MDGLAGIPTDRRKFPPLMLSISCRLGGVDLKTEMQKAGNTGPEEILFQRLVYIINLTTIVENTWNYLSTITLILKRPGGTVATHFASLVVCGGMWSQHQLVECNFKNAPVS